MAAQPVNVKQVNVYLTHEQYDRLQKLKAKTGAPVSELIRRVGGSAADHGRQPYCVPVVTLPAI